MAAQNLASPRNIQRRGSLSEREVHEIEGKLASIALELDKIHKSHHDTTVENMTEDEKVKFAAFKDGLVKSAHLQDLDPDRILMKYLVAAGLDVNLAVSNYSEYRRWRVEHKVDSVLNGQPPYNGLVSKVIPHAYPGFDKEGHPLYIEKTGKVRVAELNQYITNDMFIDSHVYGMESLIKMMAQSSKKLGKPIDTMTVILDLDGLAFSHANAVPMLQKATSFDFKFYPDRVYKIFVINAPWIAPTLWEMVKVFLDEGTKSKVTVLGVDFKEELLKYIDADQLPKEYGGTAPDIPVANDDEIKDVLNRDAAGLPLQEEYVSAGYHFTVDLAGKKGDIFQWSFQIGGGYDIQFSVEMKTDAGVTSTLQEASKLIIHKGNYTATEDCVLTFMFDNSYSYFNGKELKYHASVIIPEAPKL